MITNDDRQKLEALVELWLDCELTHAQAEELSQLLKHQDCRDILNHRLRMHVDLAEALGKPLRPFTASELESLGADKELSDATEPSTIRIPHFPFFPLTDILRNPTVWLVVMALGFATWFWLENQRDREIQISNVESVAKIVKNLGGAVGDSIDPERNLFAGDFIEFDVGAMEIEFHSGAELVLTGPIRFQVVSGTEVRLDFGSLTGRVNANARGFRIITPDGVVEDVGTEFGVRSGGSQKLTRVQVYDGEVRLYADAEATDSVTVRQGELGDLKSGEISKEEHSTRELSLVRSIATPDLELDADADTYIVGGDKSNDNAGDEPLLLVKRDELAPVFNRRAIIRFALPKDCRERLLAAELVLTIDPNSIAAQASPGNVVADRNWRFTVGGIWDQFYGRWSEMEISWLNAPAHNPESVTGNFFGPTAPVGLGTFEIQRHGEKGQAVTVTGASLLNFLREDDDGQVTFLISRLTGYKWNAAPGSSEDAVVHSFASRENSKLPGPKLKLWLLPEN